MEIRLPFMPFKFDSPEGPMEITVRPLPFPSEGDKEQQFGAAATFIQPGSRALQRIKLSVKAASHRGAMLALTTGFKVNPAAHGTDSPEYRILTALCHAQGVVDVND